MSESETTLESLKCAECNAPATMKCSACRTVAYCGKDHQKIHWKTHKLTCRPFEIHHCSFMCRFDELKIKKFVDLGRCLVASRDLQPGDIILSEIPIVYGPRPHMIEKGPVPCPGCCRLIIADKSPRCEGCDWPVCNQDCDGLKDPARHGYECFIVGLRAHRALGGLHEYYRQDVLFAVRCLLIQRRGIKKWSQFLDMESHVATRKPGTDEYKDVDERVVKYLTDNFLVKLKTLEEATNNSILPDVSAETIHKICGIIDVNALEINQDGELSALYQTACLMEHSCLPNTFHTFDTHENHYKITVRAALPIKKGDNITTMYTHALWGTQARREHLKETKYFDCTCKRCSDPTEMGTYLSALRCMGSEELGPCNGVQLPINPIDSGTEWACDKCPIKLSGNDVAYLVNQIGEEVDSIQVSNPTVRDLDGVLTKILTFLHPNHYHVYAVKHSLVQLYGYQQGYMPNQISDELLKTKAKMCRELLDVTKKIDPGNSRLCLYSGVLFHELYLANMIYIKRKWDVGIKKDLVKLIKEAKESLKNGMSVLKYETTSPAGEKLNQLLFTSSQEIEKWLSRYKVDLSKEY